MYIILADRQDITRAGMMYYAQTLADTACRQADDKTEMIEQLKEHPDAVIILDYTLFDINDVEELEILFQRFPLAQVGQQFHHEYDCGTGRILLLRQ